NVGAGLPLRAWLWLCCVTAGSMKSAAQLLSRTAFVMRAPGMNGRVAFFGFFLRFLRRGAQRLVLARLAMWCGARPAMWRGARRREIGAGKPHKLFAELVAQHAG